jgi:glucokinase
MMRAIDRTATPDETVLAVEVGAARMTAAVVDRSGFIRLSRHHATSTDTKNALGELTELTTSVLAQARTDVSAVGVAVAADVDPESGVVRHSGEIGWHNVPVGDALAKALGRPVLVDRAVRAAARAEGQFGAAAGTSDWLYIVIDDDIQAAATVAGSLLRGATGAAGEIGHIPIYPFGLRCPCGQRGCVVPYAGATAIRQRYRELAGRDASIVDIAARFGRDPLVDEVWQQACAALALALATYTLIQDPELIVLGGELAAAGGVLLSAVGAELRGRLAWRQAPRLLIATAATPVLRGAALLAWSALRPADAVRATGGGRGPRGR